MAGEALIGIGLEAPRGEGGVAAEQTIELDAHVVHAGQAPHEAAHGGALGVGEERALDAAVDDEQAPPFEALSPNAELAALIPGFQPTFASDDYIVQRRAAEAGGGAIFLGRVRHRFSLEGTLVPLGLELGAHGKSQLHLVCAKSALAVPRIRVVAELLAEELRWAEEHAPVARRRADRCHRP